LSTKPGKIRLEGDNKKSSVRNGPGKGEWSEHDVLNFNGNEYQTGGTNSVTLKIF